MYLEIPPKTGKKVGIHFYENILSQINLPLIKSTEGNKLPSVIKSDGGGGGEWINKNFQNCQSENPEEPLITMFPPLFELQCWPIQILRQYISTRYIK